MERRKPNIDFQKKRPEATGEERATARIIVETDEENPVTICEYTNGEFIIADGYRVRIKP